MNDYFYRFLNWILNVVLKEMFDTFLLLMDFFYVCMMIKRIIED